MMPTGSPARVSRRMAVTRKAADIFQPLDKETFYDVIAVLVSARENHTGKITWQKLRTLRRMPNFRALG
jgi:hypothetical protein